jgi:hypothetical protein
VEEVMAARKETGKILRSMSFTKCAVAVIIAMAGALVLGSKNVPTRTLMFIRGRK